MTVGFAFLQSMHLAIAIAFKELLETFSSAKTIIEQQATLPTK
ncbi:hypothetical protein S7335_344 [Synechococcus sp. PCC 7335]|nr:hypothetical protein S7335_344 [Synechococcus sp. PCC 7335]